MEEKAQRNDSMGLAAQYAIYLFTICTSLHYYGIDEELFHMAAETWPKHLERLRKRPVQRRERQVTTPPGYHQPALLRKGSESSTVLDEYAPLAIGLNHQESPTRTSSTR